MADRDQIKILRRGANAWNTWRSAHPSVQPNLVGAKLRGANLRGINLQEADLSEAGLFGADLTGADLSKACLRGAWLNEAHLTDANLQMVDAGAMTSKEARAALKEGRYGWSSEESIFIMPGGGATFERAHLMNADLTGANLVGANFDKAYLLRAKLVQADLSWASLTQANLRRANFKRANLVGAVLRWATLDRALLDNAILIGADLSGAQLVQTRLAGTHLTGCHIYGISAWGLEVSERTKQQNLRITTAREPEITTDNIEIAQFLYLILHNEKLRGVINSLTTKAVLLLGRFKPERKAILDALREELRRRDYLPILFDFDVPAGRDITETVSLLAHMVRFIIADLTDPSSIPKELETIVPDLAVPVQPLLEGSSQPYSMFKDYWKYDWILPPHRYEGLNPLLATLAEKVIAPAEAKVKALEERRRAIEEELMARP